MKWGGATGASWGEAKRMTTIMLDKELTGGKQPTASLRWILEISGERGGSLMGGFCAKKVMKGGEKARTTLEI